MRLGGVVSSSRTLARSVAVLLGLFGASCATPDVELSLGLITDWVAGVEFSQVRVVILDRAVETVPAFLGERFAPGARRIADLSLPPSADRRLRVELVDDNGTVIASRSARIDHRRSFAGTLVLARRCEDVQCDAGQTCIAGTCRDERCIDPSDPICGPAECANDEACGDPWTECASARCVAGACVAVAEDVCGASEYCDPVRGCRPVPGTELDAGLGVDSGSPTDADVVTADAPDVGSPGACDAPGVLVCEAFEGSTPPLDLEPGSTGVVDRSFGRGAGGSLRLTSTGGMARLALSLARPISAGERLHARAWFHLSGDFSLAGGYIVLLQAEADDAKISVDLVDGDRLQLAIKHDPAPSMFSAGSTMSRNAWLCVELAIDVGATGDARAFVDGASNAALLATNTVPGSGAFRSIQVGVEYTGGFSGTTDIHVDDVVVSTNPIGCADSLAGLRR